jgi:hypothetical protein
METPKGKQEKKKDDGVFPLKDGYLPASWMPRKATTTLKAARLSSSNFSHSCLTDMALAFVEHVDFSGSMSLSKPLKRVQYKIKYKAKHNTVRTKVQHKIKYNTKRHTVQNKAQYKETKVPNKVLYELQYSTNKNTIQKSAQYKELTEGDARTLDYQILEAIVTLSWVKFRFCWRFSSLHKFASFFFICVHSTNGMVRLGRLG